MLLSTIRWLALAAIILGPTCAMAQTSASPTATSTAQLLKPAELDQLVAPIALYPDPLLAQVLMASAYPLDIVQAERWLEANKNLKGEALKAAVDKQSWDDSIKSLVATPDVLQLMSSKLDWTQKLGDAVVAQQADVMDAIQRLRPTPTWSMVPITTRVSSMAIGRMRIIRRITGPRPAISAPASSPLELALAPATRSGVGTAEITGAAGSTGTTTISMSGPAVAAPARPGGPASTIAKAPAIAAIARNS
jgi:hypothetical protein